MTYCPHCRRGMTPLHMACAMALLSTIIGTFAGVAVQLPTEGAALGMLHAIAPIAALLEEAI